MNQPVAKSKPTLRLEGEADGVSVAEEAVDDGEPEHVPTVSHPP
jgi:hypothetical protein